MQAVDGGRRKAAKVRVPWPVCVAKVPVPSSYSLSRYGTFAMRWLATLLLAGCVAPAVAPTGDPTGAILRRLQWPMPRRCASAGTSPPRAVPASQAAVAAAAAVLLSASVVCSVSRVGQPPCEADTLHGIDERTSRKPGRVDLIEEVSMDSSEDSPASSDACISMSSDEQCADSADCDVPLPPRIIRSKKPGSGHLWSNAKFPEGVSDSTNWNLENLKAVHRAGVVHVQTVATALGRKGYRSLSFTNTERAFERQLICMEAIVMPLAKT